MTPGYLDNPEANAEAFFGGWFRTGDRGVARGTATCACEGRLKEMIIRGGENISPAEIEEVLLAHPAVADAVCFGVADDKYGELVGRGGRARTATSTPRELIGTAASGWLRSRCPT